MKVISLRGVLVMGVVGIAACEFDGTPTGVTVGTGTAPPTPSVTATTTVLGDSTASPSLQITAVVQNTFSVMLFMAGGGQCPLYISILPGSVGAQSESPQCTGAGAIQLGAHDSLVFTKVIRADSLAIYPAGTYTIQVTVLSAPSTDFSSGSYFTSASAGTVQLPLGQGAVGVQP